MQLGVQQRAVGVEELHDEIGCTFDAQRAHPDQLDAHVVAVRGPLLDHLIGEQPAVLGDAEADAAARGLRQRERAVGGARRPRPTDRTFDAGGGEPAADRRVRDRCTAAVDDDAAQVERGVGGHRQHDVASAGGDRCAGDHDQLCRLVGEQRVDAIGEPADLEAAVRVGDGEARLLALLCLAVELDRMEGVATRRIDEVEAIAAGRRAVGVAHGAADRQRRAFEQQVELAAAADHVLAHQRLPAGAHGEQALRLGRRLERELTARIGRRLLLEAELQDGSGDRAGGVPHAAAQALRTAADRHHRHVEATARGVDAGHAQEREAGVREDQVHAGGQRGVREAERAALVADYRCRQRRERLRQAAREFAELQQVRLYGDASEG